MYTYESKSLRKAHALQNIIIDRHKKRPRELPIIQDDRGHERQSKPVILDNEDRTIATEDAHR